jgi:hypothetical protein
VSLGGRVYMIGQLRRVVTDPEDEVLQAFLGDATRPAAERPTESALRKRCSQKHPTTILRRLRQKYQGMLGAAIYPPSGKGEGWGVRITRIPQ